MDGGKVDVKSTKGENATAVNISAFVKDEQSASASGKHSMPN